MGTPGEEIKEIEEDVEVKVVETEDSIEAEVVDTETDDEIIETIEDEVTVEDEVVESEEDKVERLAKEKRISIIEGEVGELLAEYKELTALKGGKTLINGFRNKTVIFPLAVLQNRIEKFEKVVDNNFKTAEKNVREQFEYMYSSITKNARANNLMSLTVEAISRLLDVSEKDLEVEVKKIEAERIIEKEVEEDTKRNRKVVDRAAKDGDIVKISYEGTIDGEKFPGGSIDSKGFHLTLGSGQFIPGFEDQLIGVEKGETVEVKVSFPEDYGNKDIAGKEAIFVTNVLVVKELIREIIIKDKKEETPKTSEG